MKNKYGVLIIVLGMIMIISSGGMAMDMNEFEAKFVHKSPDFNLPIIEKTSKTDALKDKRIVVVAGHGAGGGTRSPEPYVITEADANLRVALQLRDMLEEVGAVVIMARETDVAMSLQDRVKLNKESNSDLFVSIHHNANARLDLDYDRSEAFYHWHDRGGPSEDVARELIYQMENALEIPGSKTYVVWAYGVLRENVYPAILGEASYQYHTNWHLQRGSKEALNNEAISYFNTVAHFFNSGRPKIEYSEDKSGSAFPVIKANLKDLDLRIDPAGIRVELAGEVLPFTYNTETGDLAAVPTAPMAAGKYPLEISARNIRGNHAPVIRTEVEVLSAVSAINAGGSIGSVSMNAMYPRVIHSDGISQQRIDISVSDEYGLPVADGTVVKAEVSAGSLDAETYMTSGGRAAVYFTAPEKKSKVKLTVEYTPVNSDGEIKSGRSVKSDLDILLDSRSSRKKGRKDAQASDLYLTGRISGASGAYISCDGSFLTRADENGWFYFENLAAGLYDFRIECPGFWPLEKEVIIKDGTTILNPEMKPMFGGVLHGKKVVVDPEYGGIQTGARTAKGLRASDINLRTGLFLEEFIRQAGGEPLMTRRIDRTVDDVDRIRFGLSNEPDHFISIRHLEPRPGHNDPADLNVSWVMSRWGEGRVYGAAIGPELSEMLGTDRGYYEGSSTFEVMHAMKGYDAIGVCPMLVTAPGAAERLETQACLRKEAFAIVNGLLRYYELKKYGKELKDKKITDKDIFQQMSDKTGLVSGVVKDAATGELLAEALVGVDNWLITQTEADGKYMFKCLDPGKYRIVVSAPGYKTLAKEVDLKAGTKIKLNLEMNK